MGKIMLARQPSAARRCYLTSITTKIVSRRDADRPGPGSGVAPMWPQCTILMNWNRPAERCEDVKGLLSTECGSSKAFQLLYWWPELLIESIWLIMESMPPEKNSPTLSAEVKLVILTHQRCCVYDGAFYRTLLFQSRLSLFLVFWGSLLFPAACSTRQTQFSLLSINLGVSSQGNKSNSGAFAWRTALEQRTSTSPSHLLDISKYYTHIAGKQCA